MAPGRRAEAIFDAVLASDAFDRRTLASFPDGVGWIWATMELEGQVANGGFHQYFWNTGGRLLDLAIAGYEAFGCPRHAELARRAARIAGRELDASQSHEHANVQAWLEAFHRSATKSSLSPLDEEWYALSSVEDQDRSREEAITRDTARYATDRAAD